MLKRCLQLLLRAAVVSAIGVSWGIASVPQAQAQSQWQQGSGFVAENGTYPIQSVVFSSASVRYLCRYGGSGYLGQTTESERLFFRSATVAPRSGLRVRIWNISGVFSAGAVPYTDREYDEGVRSEGFDVRPGTGHEGRYFIVSASQIRPVVNAFRYEILDSNTVVERGEFEGEFFDRFVGNRTVYDDPVYCPFPSPHPRPGPYPFPSPYPWP